MAICTDFFSRSLLASDFSPLTSNLSMTTSMSCVL